MGEEGSKRVLERVADVLARLGGDPRGARPRTGSDRSGRSTGSAPPTGPSDLSTDAEQRRAVTDGGADGAPPGDVPWAEDDPIVFGDDGDGDPGAAILDAVTDSDAAAAPPFGDDAATADAHLETGSDVSEVDDADAVDPERLDELEARLDALESDHVQLETSLADVAQGLARINDELSATREDVGLLVATLGGIAIAREGQGRDGASDDPTGLATALEDIDGGELADAIASRAESEETEGVAVGNEDDEDGPGPGETGDDSTAEAARNDEPFDEDTPPEGIHRGAGEAPSPSTGDEPVTRSERAAAEGEEEKEDPSATTDEAVARTADEPARELVDPRTDAVGARLRQFREGFVDDPTADLPTGNSADEFRFDKVLLPTDGEAAPDLSNAELEKPYLETLPDGYAVDAVVLEWLDWLVSAADGEVAAQAVEYYESIGWLTAEVREDLLGYLEGLGETTLGPGTAGAKATDEAAGDGPTEPPAALDLQDHLHSLQYVTELASGEVGTDGF
jgi:archaellum component FlaD/FlaE